MDVLPNFDGAELFFVLHMLCYSLPWITDRDGCTARRYCTLNSFVVQLKLT
jgi:hypothetical protein